MRAEGLYGSAAVAMGEIAKTSARELRIAVEHAGEVSAVLLRPPQAETLLVLAHGAGAGMRHPFLEALAQELAAVHIATLRYQFPYMEHRRKVPDVPNVLTATVRAAVRAAAEQAPELPLFAGGKSMGGRMTSQTAAQQPLDHALGLAFVGFPLHPPGRPGTQRAEHLARVSVPMLFLQGARDQFAHLDLLRPVCSNLGPRATLHVVEGADHSFHVLKSSGTTDAKVLTGLAQTVASWAKTIRRAKMSR
jgi:predicted alpha/beta-hydrolase family hydrolase